MIVSGVPSVSSEFVAVADSPTPLPSGVPTTKSETLVCPAASGLRTTTPPRPLEVCWCNPTMSDPEAVTRPPISPHVTVSPSVPVTDTACSSASNASNPSGTVENEFAPGKALAAPTGSPFGTVAGLRAATSAPSESHVPDTIDAAKSSCCAAREIPVCESAAKPRLAVTSSVNFVCFCTENEPSTVATPLS